MDRITVEGVSETKPVVFRVRLLSGRGVDFSEDGIIREIAILPSDTLYNLARVILRSVNFDYSDHLFMFCNKMPFGWNPERICYELVYEDDQIYPDLRGVSISEALRKMGHKLILWFDYGDDWLFRIKLLKKPPKIPEGCPLPCVIRKEGEPPEQSPAFDDENGES